MAELLRAGLLLRHTTGSVSIMRLSVPGVSSVVRHFRSLSSAPSLPLPLSVSIPPRTKQNKGKNWSMMYTYCDGRSRPHAVLVVAASCSAV